MPDIATFAYIIMCHHKPEQALRLARTIRALSPRSRVLLRHDQPSGYIDATQAEDAGAELLRSEIRCRWGSWSLVEATLEAFATARRIYQPDWTVLVSGQDYPIRRLRAWEDEVLAKGVDALVAGDPLVDGPIGWRFREGRDGLRMRYTHRWQWMPRLGLVPRLPRRVVRVTRAVWYRYLFPMQALVVLNELPHGEGWALGIRRRRTPFTEARPAYKGEQWMALSSVAVTTSLDSDIALRWREWFKSTLIPDESYFPTLIADAPHLRVEWTGITWHRWNPDVSKPHPIDIDLRLLDEVRRSGKPFARKFDEARHPGVLDELDRRLAREATEAT